MHGLQDQSTLNSGPSLLPGHNAGLHFPGFFAVRCGYVTAVRLMDWSDVCHYQAPQKILQTILHALSLMTWGLGDVRSLGPWIIIWKRVLCQSETPICILCEWETCFLLCLNNYTHIFWGLLVTAAGVIFNNDSIRASALTSYVTSAGYLTSQDPTSKIAIQ